MTKRKPQGQAAKDAEALRDMATRMYKGDEEKVDKFVDLTMTRLGHRRRVEYDDAEPEEETPEGEEEEDEDELLSEEEDEEDEEPTPRRTSKRYFGK